MAEEEEPLESLSEDFEGEEEEKELKPPASITVSLAAASNMPTPKALGRQFQAFVSPSHGETTLKWCPMYFQTSHVDGQMVQH